MRPPPPSWSSVSPSALDSLGWFVGERQRVWYRRHVEGRERPWTTDAVLASTHLTNVLRTLDPGMTYALDALRDLPSDEALWFAVAYRGLNRRATFEEFGRPPTSRDRDEWLRYLDARRARREPVVIGRHRTPRSVDYAAALRAVTPGEPPGDARATLARVRALRGYGPFLAWQVCADLLTARSLPRDDDLVLVSQGSAFAVAVLAGLLGPRNDYAMPGAYARPGDQQRVRPREVEEESFNAWVRWLRDEQRHWLPVDFGDVAPRALATIDVEHALCEWGRWVVAWHDRGARSGESSARLTVEHNVR